MGHRLAHSPGVGCDAIRRGSDALTATYDLGRAPRRRPGSRRPSRARVEWLRSSADPAADGSGLVQQFEVHGVAVAVLVNAEHALDSKSPDVAPSAAIDRRLHGECLLEPFFDVFAGWLWTVFANLMFEKTPA